jgi:hypothetical protein
LSQEDWGKPKETSVTAGIAVQDSNTPRIFHWGADSDFKNHVFVFNWSIIHMHVNTVCLESCLALIQGTENDVHERLVSRNWITQLHTLPVLHFNYLTTEYSVTTAHFIGNFNTDNQSTLHQQLRYWQPKHTSSATSILTTKAHFIGSFDTDNQRILHLQLRYWQPNLRTIA